MRTALTGALLLTGCAAEPPELEQARRAAAETFAYPTSAQFQNVRLGSQTYPGLVCGEIRARGLDGQMTDYRRFKWQPGLPVLVEGTSPTEGMARVNDRELTIGCS